MQFYQEPPRLGNQFDDDPLLVSWIARFCPQIADELRMIGQLSVECYDKQLADRHHEPVLTQWDAWGQRIDKIEVTPLWREAQVLAARHGMVAAGYEPRLGAYARTHQFAIIHLLAPSLDVYSCPLAMTDGAARTLLASGNQPLIDRYVPRLVTRDPANMWTSGQWMTERTGGSDVSRTETVARKVGDGWRLHGTKWFTSATTSDIALTLARPEGNAEGSRGLALFLVELHDEAGRLRGIQINRLKDKLGTRKVPTAELTLDGTPAVLVGSLGDGVRAITPMLSVTRIWNAVGAVNGMRRGLALAGDYATRRTVFGALLADKPLHADTLAALEAEYAAAFCLAFRAVELLGMIEHGAVGQPGAHEPDDPLARTLIPIAKLVTAKQAVAVVAEAIEACGGAGYVEDTGLPRVLADAHVLPIWEGTTNVLSLDTLRALGKGGAVEALEAELQRSLAGVRDPGLALPGEVARAGFRHAIAWVRDAMAHPTRLEAGARRFALTLGKSLELALLAAHAQWCLDNGFGPRTAAAARRFAQSGIDHIGHGHGDPASDAALDDTRLLVARSQRGAERGG
ncbi:MAG TPA: acyl-CoA dehydrogenase family protein [Kofleriaceae bacterium]|nr:acyl-CoA dehydrogenase family protein [Kofleriaceae bacterium]